MNPAFSLSSSLSRLKGLFCSLDNRNRISVVLIAGIYLEMVLSGGGKGLFFPVIVSALSLFLVILNWSSLSTLHFGKLEKGVVVSLGLFISYSCVSTILASDVYLSLQGLNVWLICISIFSVGLIVGLNRSLCSLVSFILFLIGFVLCVYDLGFLIAQDNGYLRLSGSFLDPNIYGGFIIFLISFALMVFSRGKNLPKIVKPLVFGVLASALILTFSRGSWIAVLVGVMGFAFLSSPKKFALIRTRPFLREFILCSVSTAIITSSVFFVTTGSTSLSNKVASVRGYETSSENGLSARVHYVEDALKVYFQNPFFGTGFKNYIFSLRAINDNPVYFSTNVHNTYLDTFVSTGLGGLFFLAFVGFLLLLIVRLRKNASVSEDSVIQGGVFVIIAMFAHMVVEADSDFPAIMTLFFLVLGIFVAKQAFYFPTHIKEKQTYFSKGILAVSLIIGLVASVFSALYYFSQNKLVDGNYYMLLNNPEKAVTSYSDALSYIPFDSESFFNRAVAKERIAQIEKKPDDVQSLLLGALDDAKRASVFSPIDTNASNLQAEILLRLGDMDTAERILNEVKKQDPRNIKTSIMLITLYLKGGRKESALGEARSFLPSLIEYSKTTTFKQDPNRGNIVDYINNASIMLGSSVE